MARILVLTNMYPPHHFGGYELQCQDIVHKFRARGHECSVLTSTVRLPGLSDPPGDIDDRVRRTLRIYWEDHRIIRARLTERATIERHNQRALVAALTEFRPDVVSVWHMGAMSLGLIGAVRRAGVPMVFVICDDWLCYGPHLDGWTSMFANRPTLTRLLRPVVERIDGLPVGVGDVGRDGPFLFVSRWTMETARRDSPWTYPDATVVYSGIDADAFARPAAENPRPWRWRLLCAGRIDARKGVDTAIRALARLPAHATLTIVGRGDDRVLADLYDLARGLGLADRITWDVTDRAGLARRYVEADVLVFPVTWEEPFGLVPVEAMASGTPVVATARGGSGEFLIDGINCVRFTAGDDRALAEAISHLGGDPELRARLVTAGRRTAEELTIEHLADVLEAWHTGAATGFREGRPPERPPIQKVIGAADTAGH